MNNVLLISEKYLKTNSLINDNVDSCYIVPAIETAQELGLQQIIGTKLYTTICRMVDDGSITGNTDYKYLLDTYILPYLTQKVLADIQIPLFGKIRNSGIIQSTDMQTQQLSIKDVQYIKNDFETKATFYGNRLVDYLIANCQKYPEYHQVDTTADMPSGSDGQTLSGIYMGKNPKCRKRNYKHIGLR